MAVFRTASEENLRYEGGSDALPLLLAPFHPCIERKGSPFHRFCNQQDFFRRLRSFWFCGMNSKLYANERSISAGDMLEKLRKWNLLQMCCSSLGIMHHILFLLLFVFIIYLYMPDCRGVMRSHEELDRVLSEFRTLNISRRGWLTKAEILRVLNPVFQYSPLPHSIASAFDRSGDHILA